MQTILVTGATGNQGGAVVDALVGAGSFNVLALTRNADSAAATALAKKPNVKVLQGDLDCSEEVFERAGGKGAVYGVFSVQHFAGEGQSVETEEKQGKVGA